MSKELRFFSQIRQYYKKRGFQ